MSTIVQDPTLPLGLRSDVRLTCEQSAMLHRLERAEFPYVREKLLADAKIDENEVDEAIFEFRRYMALSALSDNTLSMLSPVVDEVWHQFILFTRHYSRFCREVFGRYIHHLPATSHTPLTPGAGQNLVVAYETFFGPLTRLWAEGTRANCPEQCSASTGDNRCNTGQCDGTKDD